MKGCPGDLPGAKHLSEWQKPLDKLASLRRSPRGCWVEPYPTSPAEQGAVGTYWRILPGMAVTVPTTVLTALFILLLILLTEVRAIALMPIALMVVLARPALSIL